MEPPVLFKGGLITYEDEGVFYFIVCVEGFEQVVRLPIYGGIEVRYIDVNRGFS